MRSAAAILVCLLPAAALAHGGEDHGPPPAAGGGAAPTNTAYLVSRTFELTVKWPSQAPGTDLHLTLWLADPITNRPLDGAEIALEINGPGGQVPATVAPGGSPGTYLAHLTPPQAGAYGAVAQVTAASQTDLLTAEGLILATEPAPVPAAEHSHLPWPWIGAGGGALLVILVLAAVLRRRQAPAAGSALAAMLALYSAAAWSHGGEDHGPPVRTAPVSGEGFVAKEVQFLLGLETAEIAEQPIRPTLEALGTVAARTDLQAVVTPPQAGTLRAPPNASLPRVGDRVARDQVLAFIEEIPAATDRIALGQARIEAKAALAQASAQVNLARKKLARAEGLAGTVARVEIEEAEAVLALAQAEAAGARRRVELLDRGLPETRLFEIPAPVGGVLFKAAGVAGARAEPGVPLFEIVDDRVMWVEARVFAHDAGRAEDGQEAEILVTDVPDPLPGRRVTAAGSVDPTTQTFPIRFEVANPKGLLRPGMLVEVRIGLGEATARLATPDAAVAEHDGVPGVYVKVDPEHFLFRPARLGTLARQHREVLAGLSRGDLVVVQAAGALD